MCSFVEVFVSSFFFPFFLIRVHVYAFMYNVHYSNQHFDSTVLICMCLISSPYVLYNCMDGKT